MLSWASRFNICCFLDNHSYSLPYHSEECLCGVDAAAMVLAEAGEDALGQLEQFARQHKDWIFGHVGYDVAEETEPVGEVFSHVQKRQAKPGVIEGWKEQTNAGILPDRIGFPDLFFFVPVVVVRLQKESIEIGSIGRNPAEILDEIRKEKVDGPDHRPASTETKVGPGAPPSTGQYVPQFRARFSREEYLGTVETLRGHILRGDCYEINFCQEFYSQPATIDPLAVWRALSEVSPNPFSAFYRIDDRYLLCASPERYLKKEGSRLLSQPIKGTSRRFPEDALADQASRDALFHSAKDRSENVMVVDLVRNDLSRICEPGTVRVDELYGVYGFPQVYQMISTVSGELTSAMGLGDVFKAAFPMGSMTGAPKRSVVKLIHEYERTRRGIFSGTVGYIRPDGDFDLNVVIRSLLYNSKDSYLSYLVGSGITWYSDPAQEYEECMVKAEGMKRALSTIGR